MKKNVFMFLKFIGEPVVSFVVFLGALVGVLTYFGIEVHKKTQAPTAIALPAKVQVVPPPTVVRGTKARPVETTVTQANHGKNGTNVGTVHGNAVINHGAPQQAESQQAKPPATPQPSAQVDKQISQINTGDNGTNIKTVDGDLRLNFNQPEGK